MEHRTTPDSMTIIVQFVGAKDGRPVHREPTGVKDSGSSWAIQRHAGESIEAMHSRAATRAPRNGYGVASLVETYA